MSTPDDYDKRTIFDELSRHAPMDLVRTLLARHAELVREELEAEGGNRLTYGGKSREVVAEPVPVDVTRDGRVYEVWVRGDDDG